MSNHAHFLGQNISIVLKPSQISHGNIYIFNFSGFNIRVFEVGLYVLVQSTLVLYSCYKNFLTGVTLVVVLDGRISNKMEERQI